MRLAPLVIYSELPYKLPPSDACLGDLINSNPQAYSHMRGDEYLTGSYGPYVSKKQFVPDNVRHCREVNIRGDNLYEKQRRRPTSLKKSSTGDNLEKKQAGSSDATCTGTMVFR